MVDRSDLVVFCIQRESGGAWQTMKYAKKQGKPLIVRVFPVQVNPVQGSPVLGLPELVFPELDFPV